MHCVISRLGNSRFPRVVVARRSRLHEEAKIRRKTQSFFMVTAKVYSTTIQSCIFTVTRFYTLTSQKAKGIRSSQEHRPNAFIIAAVQACESAQQLAIPTPHTVRCQHGQMYRLINNLYLSLWRCLTPFTTINYSQVKLYPGS